MRGLLIVDVQNDFCPGGALAVPDGDQVVPIINRLLNKFPVVVASKDWHPAETVHFEKWPPHCVQDTKGADFHPDLRTGDIAETFLKGTGNKDDGYSAFEATNKDLGKFLKKKGVKDLYIVGLATDYCVKESAKDAFKHGFNYYVVTDACKAVNVNPGDGEAALKELEAAGAHLITSSEA